MSPGHPAFTRDDYERLRRERRNWGRWGVDDQLGAAHLITNEVRRAAGAFIQTGQTVALGRPFPKSAGQPADSSVVHYMNEVLHQAQGGAATDFLGVACHGPSTTHIDALGHLWDSDGMWNGRDPKQEVQIGGVAWASVEHLARGILTRGVLLDVVRHRGGEPVTLDEPVHGWELEEICRSRGIEPHPGDGLVVHSGRELWEERFGRPWGTPVGAPRPGLHPSCLEFLRESDCALLVWDMHDALPTDLEVPWPVHAALFWFGIPLVDNAFLAELSDVAKEHDRDEFVIIITPLRVSGATGCAVNPLCVF